MFRNQYDSDVTVWSPQGRIHQIEYAMEAVKQGSATVAIKSNTYVVMVALKRAANELSSHQKKILPIHDNIGVSVAGLLSDARLLARFMQSECLRYKWVHQEPIPVSILMDTLGNKLQINTQRYGRRPFGVGLLVAGYDEKGTHIHQSCPSANIYDCRAMAIGARSQSARTYLEKKLDIFAECDLADLIRHALLALRDTLPNEISLSTKNTTVAVVGKDTPFTIFEDADVQPHLDSISDVPRGPPPPPDQPGPAAPMEIEEPRSAPTADQPQVDVAVAER